MLKEINFVVEQCKRINIVLWEDVKIKALPCWNKHEVTHVMHVTLVTWIIWCANECV